MEITNETPVVMLTVGQLKEMLKSEENPPIQMMQSNFDTYKKLFMP